MQRSGSSDRPVGAMRTATSSDAGTAASEEDAVVIAGQPFYPQVEVCHVETPSKFYVLELARKDALAE